MATFTFLTRRSQKIHLTKRFISIRLLSSNVQTTQKLPVTTGKDMDEQPFRSWMLRLSHENGFLSWSRNAAICAGIDATISMIDKPMNAIMTYGFVDLGVVFMTIGSLHHIASSYMLRGPLKITHIGLLWIFAYTASIWFCYCLLVKPKLKEQIGLLN